MVRTIKELPRMVRTERTNPAQLKSSPPGVVLGSQILLAMHYVGTEGTEGTSGVLRNFAVLRHSSSNLSSERIRRPAGYR